MEVTDAYQEYLCAKHEVAPEDKIAQLTLPVSHMAAIANVILEALDGAEGKLSAPTMRKWDSIMRSIAKAIEGAV